MELLFFGTEIRRMEQTKTKEGGKREVPDLAKDTDSEVFVKTLMDAFWLLLGISVNSIAREKSDGLYF